MWCAIALMAPHISLLRPITYHAIRAQLIPPCALLSPMGFTQHRNADTHGGYTRPRYPIYVVEPIEITLSISAHPAIYCGARGVTRYISHCALLTPQHICGVRGEYIYTLRHIVEYIKDKNQ